MDARTQPALKSMPSKLIQSWPVFGGATTATEPSARTSMRDV